MPCPKPGHTRQCADHVPSVHVSSCKCLSTTKLAQLLLASAMQQVDRFNLLLFFCLQLLLQLYQPLIINRSKAAAALNPGVDERELTDAAARAVLTAAAKYDRQKAGRNTRLSSLAAVYIKTAVRDVLQEVSLHSWLPVWSAKYSWQRSWQQTQTVAPADQPCSSC